MVKINKKLLGLVFFVLLLTSSVSALSTIENVTTSSITNESVIITWDADNLSNSSVNYNTSLTLGLFVRNSSNVTQGHMVNLSGLLPNTLYYYNVSCCDNESTCVESGPYNFTTDGPPTISNITNSSATNESIVIYWDTDKNSSSVIEYGTNTSLSSSTTNTTNVTANHQVLLSNLTANITYYYNITSCNAYGCFESGPYNFTTLNTSSACQSITQNTTLLNNVNANGSCYLIQNDSITFDCNGFSIIGNRTGMGINVTNMTSVTIKNCQATNFTYGIYSYNSTITLINNTPSANINQDYYLYGGGITLNDNNQFNGIQTLINDTVVSSSSVLNFLGSSNSTIDNSTFSMSEVVFKGTSTNTIFLSEFSNGVTFRENSSTNAQSTGFNTLSIYSESNSSLIIGNLTTGTYVYKYMNSSTSNFELNMTSVGITGIMFYALDNSFNQIINSALGLTSFYNKTINQLINSTVSNFTINADNGSNINLNNFKPGTVNKNISSTTNNFEIYINNTSVTRIEVYAGYSTLSLHESVVNKLELANSNATIGNSTNITNIMLSSSVGNFTTSATIVTSLNTTGVSTLDGLIDMPSTLFFTGGNLTRHFPTYITNQSGLPHFNVSITIQNGTTVLWNGTTNSVGYIIYNLTFNSTNHNNSYDIVSAGEVIGNVSLLTDTPINESSDITAPNITAYQPIGTLYVTETELKIWTDEPSTCKYSLTNGTAYNSMNITLDAIGLQNQIHISGLTNGDKKYYIKCRDVSGNIGPEFVLNFSVSVYYRSSGGGGGSIKKENPKVSQHWSSVLGNGSTEMKISNEEIAFTKLIFETDTNLRGVEIDVEALLDGPGIDPKPSGIVYQYLEISKDNLKEEDLESVKIRFKVKRDWLEQQDINANDIALYKFTNKWVKLQTRKLNTESDYVHYEAIAPSFSLFAIASTTVPKPIIELEEPEEEVEEVVVEKIPTEIIEEPEEQSNIIKMTLLVVVVLVVVIAVSVGFISYKKISKSREITMVEEYFQDLKQPETRSPDLETTTSKYPELEQYIKECLSIKMPMTEIRQNLINIGWPENIVEEVIKRFL